MKYLLITLMILLAGCSEQEPYKEYGINDVSAKTQQTCPDAGNRAVLMVFGQSNAANEGQTLHTSIDAVHNFYESECYKAEDPLLGSNGTSGSVWSRLGDELVDTYDSVVISAFGRGGSSINSWVPSGGNHHLLTESIDDLVANDMMPTHILFHQGETDSILHMSTQTYYDQFVLIRQAIRDRNITAPIFIARATICMNQMNEYNYQIRDAQNMLIDNFEDIHAGPDTDLLGMEYRYDDCHFSVEGLLEHSYGWEDAILNSN